LELCEVNDAAKTANFDGVSLAPKLTAATEDLRQHVVIAGPDGGRCRHRYLAVRNSQWMLVTAMNHWSESFRQIRENEASTNLLTTALPEAGHLVLEQFRSIAERHAEILLSNKDNVTGLSETTAKKLRALGYV